MATSISLVLIAAGAILAIAVDYQAQGVNIQAIGAILIVVGIIGLVYSLLFLVSFAPLGARGERYPRDERPHTHDHV